MITVHHTFRLPDFAVDDAGGIAFPPLKELGADLAMCPGPRPASFSCHCSIPHGDSEPAYPPLHGPDAIRLLELFPGQAGDPITCRLHTTNLREAASRYSALSYSWESDAAGVGELPIVCGSRPMVIKPNLHMLLARLRRLKVPQVLWVDALCINQADVGERSSQVGLMKHIFQGAFQVCIWLGPENSSHFHTPSALSGLCALVNAWRQRQQRSGLGIASLSTYCVDTEHQTTEDETCENPPEFPLLGNPHTFRLFIRSWFHRVWVIQEAAVARSAKVFLGKYEIQWHLVGLGAAILRANLDKINLQGQENCQTGILNAYFMYRLSKCQQYFDRLEFTFHQLLKLTRGFHCQDPRDRIYGILAIPTTTTTESAVRGQGSAPFVVPDYSKTTEEVYRDVALEIIHRTRSLDILSSVQHGRSRTVKSSWVPDWQASLTLTLSPWSPSAHFVPTSGYHLEILTGKFRQHTHLTVRGIVADEISWVSDPGLPLQGTWDARLVDPQQLLSRLAAQPIDLIAEVSMVLTAGKDWYGMPVQDQSLHQADFISLMLETRTSLDCFWDMMHVPPRPHQMHMSSQDRVQTLLQQAMSGDPTRFGKTAELVGEARRRLATSAGRLGLGPMGAQAGDKVCLLFGASVPFVLRKRLDGYALVGECYVEKLMHGEATKQQENDRRPHEEWITLT